VARIRIIDEWMRSPVSTPVHQRLIMVVAETWAEQKVLMRAFQNSLDQTRPSIGLMGHELAISPAGTEPYGPWGIHVQPPQDGRAQELRGQLEQAARHMAGSKGNPPRLMDELPADERKPTTPWTGQRVAGPNERTVMPQGMAGGSQPDMRYDTEPEVNPPVASPPARVYTPQRPHGSPAPAHPQPGGYQQGYPPAAPPPTYPQAPSAGTPTPFPNYRQNQYAQGGARARRARRTAHPGSATAHGYTSTDTPVSQRRSYHSNALRPSSLATVVGKTMPIGFRISGPERVVLDALSRGGTLTGEQVALMASAPDGHAFMAELIAKLAGHGIDLVEIAGSVYRLRHR
jgi:hypothetical protein